MPKALDFWEDVVVNQGVCALERSPSLATEADDRGEAGQVSSLVDGAMRKTPDFREDVVDNRGVCALGSDASPGAMQAAGRGRPGCWKPEVSDGRPALRWNRLEQNGTSAVGKRKAERLPGRRSCGR